MTRVCVRGRPEGLVGVDGAGVTDFKLKGRILILLSPVVIMLYVSCWRRHFSDVLEKTFESCQTDEHNRILCVLCSC